MIDFIFIAGRKKNEKQIISPLHGVKKSPLAPETERFTYVWAKYQDAIFYKDLARVERNILNKYECGRKESVTRSKIVPEKSF